MEKKLKEAMGKYFETENRYKTEDGLLLFRSAEEMDDYKKMREVWDEINNAPEQKN